MRELRCGNPRSDTHTPRKTNDALVDAMCRCSGVEPLPVGSETPPHKNSLDATVLGVNVMPDTARVFSAGALGPIVTPIFVEDLS